MFPLHAVDRQFPVGAIAVRQNIWGRVQSERKWKDCENPYCRHLAYYKPAGLAALSGANRFVSRM